jgi:hypothetical protein
MAFSRGQGDAEEEVVGGDDLDGSVAARCLPALREDLRHDQRARAW